MSKKSLRGANLASSLLIVANLQHTNLWSANLIEDDLRDANLSDCLFLTQIQVNSAKGNVETKLPKWIFRPIY